MGGNSYVGLIAIALSILILYVLWKYVLYSKIKNLPFANENENFIYKNSFSKGKEITLPNKDEEKLEIEKEKNCNEEVIILKGRTKKIPRTLNYNELFVNNAPEIKENKKKKKNDTKNNLFENKEKEEDKVSNFEDFFDKINENKEVLEILNQAKKPESQKNFE